MYRRILVPVDGSTTSTLGLKHAIGLAKDQGARVRVLNVLDETFMIPAADAYPVADMTFLLDSLKATGERALKEAVAVARRSGVTAETAMVESRGRHVSDVILAETQKWRADVIVMGTHGRRGLNRVLLGSDAEGVLREAAVPVLLVRGEEAKRRTARKRARKNQGRQRPAAGVGKDINA